jgi:hypothetical protein
MGPKISLLIGVIGYCVYVCGFLFAVVSINVAVEVSWAVSCVGAAIGGMAGGLLWTAQGRYFSRHSILYAQCLGDVANVEKVNANFAGIFAMAFLGTEMFTKLVATFLFVLAPIAAPFMVFSLYTAIAVVSCFIVAALDDLGDEGTWDFSYDSVSNGAGAAARLVWADNRLKLLVPFQIAFGFASSFIPYYIFGTVIADSETLGTSYVGVLSALIVLTGAATAIPSAWAANYYGKPAVITVGAFCLAFSGLALFFLPNTVLGTWYFIVPYLIIYGVGRGTWENTNKAAIADFFVDSPDQCTAAFAATTFFNGYASAMGYFTFSSESRLDMAGTVMVSSVLSALAYLLAFRVHHNIMQRRKEDSQKDLLRKQAHNNYRQGLTASPVKGAFHHTESKSNDSWAR